MNPEAGQGVVLGYLCHLSTTSPFVMDASFGTRTGELPLSPEKLWDVLDLTAVETAITARDPTIPPPQDWIVVEGSHPPHDWIVVEGLRVPAHRLEECAVCRTWVDHARVCNHHCRQRFERARAQATIDMRADMARVHNERMEESGQFNASLLKELDEAKVRGDRCRARNDQLVGNLADVLKELGQAKAQVDQYRAANDKLVSNLADASKELDRAKAQADRYQV
ncbi:hypothetical protein BDV93DRAFT_557144, partial [Ceratobasidium sp. AG-I]